MVSERLIAGFRRRIFEHMQKLSDEKVTALTQDECKQLDNLLQADAPMPTPRPPSSSRRGGAVVPRPPPPSSARAASAAGGRQQQQQQHSLREEDLLLLAKRFVTARGLRLADASSSSRNKNPNNKKVAIAAAGGTGAQQQQQDRRPTTSPLSQQRQHEGGDAGGGVRTDGVITPSSTYSAAVPEMTPAAREAWDILAKERGSGSRRGSGTARPGSATRGSGFAAQGITALERMRDRLVVERSAPRSSEHYLSPAEQADNNALGQTQGWSPDRRDALKQKYQFGRQHLKQGLESQLEYQRRAAMVAAEKRRMEHGEMMHDVQEFESAAAERKARAAAARHNACVEANQHMQALEDRNRRERDRENEREIQRVEMQKKEFIEEEAAHRVRYQKHREKLRRELANEAKQAAWRKFHAKEEKQRTEAQHLDNVRKEIVEERERNEKMLLDSWEKHRKHAAALQKEVDARHHQEDVVEKRKAREIADAARAIYDDNLLRKREEKTRKNTEFREGLLKQIRTNNALQRTHLEEKIQTERFIQEEDLEGLSEMRSDRFAATMENQKELRRFLELQMEVSALRGNTDNDGRTKEKLKARRMMAHLQAPPKWNETGMMFPSVTRFSSTPDASARRSPYGATTS